MRIAFRKISDERHELTFVREDGGQETVVCETRISIAHDLLHYAVEAEAGLDYGLWGLLAAWHTLADMNGRSGAPLGARHADMMVVERLVGALSAQVPARAWSVALTRDG